MDVPDVMRRDEAIARGYKRYFTGKPCKHGHVAERYVKNNTCIECSDASNAANNPFTNASLKYEESRKRSDRKRSKSPERKAACNAWHRKNRKTLRVYDRDRYDRVVRKRREKIKDLLAVLAVEMPDLLKEIGL